MKISNEAKVGVIAIIALAALILGLNFLKGKKLFSKSKILIAKFGNVQGLAASNPILINGLQVGTVTDIVASDDMKTIFVFLNITTKVNIPRNSIAVIKPNPLGTTNAEIILGDLHEYAKNNDTLQTNSNAGIYHDILKRVDPVLGNINNAVGSLDSLLISFNGIVDAKNKQNISLTLENLSKLSTSLQQSAVSLESVLNKQNGTLTQTMQNLNSVSGNLANNNDKVTGILQNLDKTAVNLSQLQLKSTLDSLNLAISTISTVMNQINNGNGTAGLLLNDPTLYKNLASTSNKLNILLDDLRMNPKRYVNISVFGKKQDSKPILQPLPDTVNSPYLIQKSNP